MSKVTTSLTVDDDVLEKGKRLGLNMSGEFNEFLRNRLTPKKSDLSDESLSVKCSDCSELIAEGFRCLNNGKVRCEKCETKCKHSWCAGKDLEHVHEKIQFN